jgi:hypothetical protein
VHKLTNITGRLRELGTFEQRSTEVRYASVGVSQDGGAVTRIERVIIPNALNGMLEIDEHLSLFVARKGPWHFCYAVEVGGKLAESYDGYRLFYLFNRSMMLVNLMGGVYLLGSPGLRVAGAGLLIFGILFLWLGPPTIGRMRQFLQQTRSASEGTPDSTAPKDG